MLDTLNRFRPYVLSIFRFIVGALLMQHGLDKVFGGMLSGKPAPAAALIQFAGYIELIGGALIMLGLLTRIAAFLCSGTMCVAYFMAHAEKSFWPMVNGGELAVAYCFAFFYLFFSGPGPLSLDALFLEKRRE